LHLKGARRVSLDDERPERFLAGSRTPAAALLLLAGLVLIYVEVTTRDDRPGLIGHLSSPVRLLDAGAPALGSSCVGDPGNRLFLLEIKVPSYGFLILGGIRCLVVDAILFKDSTDCRERRGAQDSSWRSAVGRDCHGDPDDLWRRVGTSATPVPAADRERTALPDLLIARPGYPWRVLEARAQVPCARGPVRVDGVRDCPDVEELPVSAGRRRRMP